MPLGLDEQEEQEEGGNWTKSSYRKWFINATEGLDLTAADVEHVCCESAMEALREDIDINTVSMRHFKRYV